MDIKFVLTSLLLLFISCDSKVKTQDVNNVTHKYINVVENVNGYYAAYTEDGHTLMYAQDSTDNVIVYYAKFDDLSGKYGYERIKDKVVRVELNHSSNSLRSILSICVGAFIEKCDTMLYDVYYFDDQMQGNSLKRIEIPCDDDLIINTEIMSEKKIFAHLVLAYNMALSIYNNNVSGWNNMVSALEPAKNLVNYEILKCDFVNDSRARIRIKKISSASDALTKCAFLLREQLNNDIWIKQQR